MEDDAAILVTADGLSGKIELTETSVRITEYKKELFKEWKNKKIDKISVIQRKDIIETELLPQKGEFRIYILGGDYRGLTIFFNYERQPEFESMTDELDITKYWYDDDEKLSNVISYDNEEKASLDANKAAKNGWMPQSTSSTDGHINVGRTVGKTILTEGIGLVLGGESRTKGKVTITYARTPEWLEIHKKGVKILDSSDMAKTAPTASNLDDVIVQLAKLKEQGILTEEELQEQKKKILER